MSIFKKIYRKLKEWNLKHQKADCKSRQFYHESLAESYRTANTARGLQNLRYHQSEAERYRFRLEDINDALREIDTDKW